MTGAVTAGTPYWLATLSTQSGTLRFRDSSGCKSEISQQTNLTTLPSTWVSGAVWALLSPLRLWGNKPLIPHSTVRTSFAELRREQTRQVA
jgi:hypothetical protein